MQILGASCRQCFTTITRSLKLILEDYEDEDIENLCIDFIVSVYRFTAGVNRFFKLSVIIIFFLTD